MGYSKHELSTINMLYSLKKLSSYTPTSPSASYLCPRGWPLWRCSTVYPFPVCLLEVRDRSLFIAGKRGGGGAEGLGLNKVQFSRFPL